MQSNKRSSGFEGGNNPELNDPNEVCEAREQNGKIRGSVLTYESVRVPAKPQPEFSIDRKKMTGSSLQAKADSNQHPEQRSLPQETQEIQGDTKSEFDREFENLKKLGLPTEELRNEIVSFLCQSDYFHGLVARILSANRVPPDDRDDLTAEILFKMVRAKLKIEHAGGLVSYITSTTRSVAVDHIRKLANRPTEVSLAGEHDAKAAYEPDVDSMLEILEAIAQMEGPPNDATCIRLVYQERTIEEVAAELNKSLNQAKWIRTRAFREFKRTFQGLGG